MPSRHAARHKRQDPDDGPCRLRRMQTPSDRHTPYRTQGRRFHDDRRRRGQGMATPCTAPACGHRPTPQVHDRRYGQVRQRSVRHAPAPLWVARAASLDAERPKSSPCPASLSCQPGRRNGQPFRKFCQPTRKNGKPTRFSRQPARRTRRCDTITATLIRASRTDTDDRRFPIRANGKLRPRHEGRFAGVQC